eukprot:m51a1_g7118 putative intraflagellar transport protein 122 homolog isoform x2 (1281) ;mRNA; r:111972-117314
MKAVLTWTDRGLSRTESTQVTVFDLAFRPDGQQLVVAAGTRVLVYDAGDGDIIRTLKGHKSTVYCVAFSSDGKRFASGGADCTIVIWKNTLEGILKYNHNDPIQCLAYNPVTQQLCSCTASDFGECHHLPRGQHLALGHVNGEGQEQVKVTRDAGAPVWCIAWNPIPDDQGDTLAVADWDQKLAFYQYNGKAPKLLQEKALGFDPCSISFFSNGEYMCIGGSDKKASLWTKEGVFLTTIAERDDWVWACKPRPKQNYVAVGDNNGVVSMYQLVFSTVHGLYLDRYAYRDFMTDVIIQHLSTEKKFRIRCKDYVKKIAIYKDRLAVQLPSQILIYELAYDEETSEIRPRMKCKVSKNLECFLLVVTSNHIILCQEKKLQLYNFKGSREREWILESLIRYIKVVGGPRGREGLLVGLKNGQIVKIFIDNPFPISLIKQKSCVRCLDLSASRKKLAIVDENNQCLVYDLATKELLYAEPNANSVAWNVEFEDMLCFSGNGMLNIKAGTFPVHQQKMQGFVVGFKGSKIYCLHIYSMQSIDVPQSASLYRYLDKPDFDNAYKIACLGVTDADWRLLAMEALRHLNLPVAQKAFIRIRDLKYIQLVQRIELQRRQPDHNDTLFLADIAAFEGKFKLAADYYIQAGNVKKAIEMYSDLHMWEEAKALAAAALPSTGKKTRRGSDAGAAQQKSASPTAPSPTAEAAAAGGAAPEKAKRAPRRAKQQAPATPGEGKDKDKQAKDDKGATAAAAATGAAGAGAGTGAAATAAAVPAGPAVNIGQAEEEEDEGQDAGMPTKDDMVELMKKQAASNEDERNWSGAAQIYVQIGDYAKAVEIYGERNLIDELHELSQTLDRNDSAALSKAATYFIKAHKPQYAIEALTKINDIEGLVRVHVGEAQWDEAMKLAKTRPGLGELLWEPYANWLAVNDQFDKAQRILLDAGKPQAALRILEQLMEGALMTERFEDCSYFCWQLAIANLNMIKSPVGNLSPEDAVFLDRFNELRRLADLYFAYQFVHQYTLQPFTTIHNEMVFNVSRWLMTQLTGSPPVGIRKLYVLYALAKQSRNLEAYKLARYAYEKLLQQRIPPSWMDQIEVGAVTIRSKPFSDKEDLQPLCYRCSVVNPLIGKHGPLCANCRHAFVHSAWSFEVLPLVEFELEDGISDEDAMRAIGRSSGDRSAGGDSNVQTLTLDGGDEDVFSTLLEKYEQGGLTAPLRVGISVLESLRKTDVFVMRWPSPHVRTQYFKSVVSETPIVLCPACNHFFHEEDYELAVIQKNCCPFCRSTSCL